VGNIAHSRKKSPVVLTAHTGNNADLLPHILELYVPLGSLIADVTWGKGAFWTKTDTTKYDLRPTDLLTGVDFRVLPYKSASIDCLVLDPPYMHGGPTIKASLNDCYHNANTGHESVIRLYAGGLLEAARVLRKQGICIVKCQDETESGKQCFSHVELIQLLEMFGFLVIDLFVMVQSTIPIKGKGPQKSARKNHSYALVARFRR
jgi:tRNA G10  N-methylase Trm11